jgi:hypothetical protein
MLDDDDLDFAILASPSGGGWVVFLISLAIVIVVAVIVHGNKDDCAAMHCDGGQKPKLLKGECLCVTEARK